MARASSQVLATLQARTATNNSDVVESDPTAGGLLIVINFTVLAAAETVTPSIEVVDAEGNWITWCTWTAIAATGSYIKTLSQGVAATPGGAAVESKSGPVPRRFRVKFTHSASGAHTYSALAVWC